MIKSYIMSNENDIRALSVVPYDTTTRVSFYTLCFLALFFWYIFVRLKTHQNIPFITITVNSYSTKRTAS